MLTPEQEELARRLIESGMGKKKIGEEIGVSEWQIRKLTGSTGKRPLSSVRPDSNNIPTFSPAIPPPLTIKPEGRLTVAFVSDVHFPFHDEKALRVFLDVVRDIQPEIIVLGGDIVDFYETSRFAKDPTRTHGLQDEIIAGRRFLKVLSEVCPNSRKIYMEGNHEYRLERYIKEQAPELVSLTDDILNVDALMHCSKYGVEYTRREIIIGNLTCIHGRHVSSHSAYTAKRNMDTMGVSNICGHIHRIGIHCRTNWRDEMISIENGCLASKAQEYLGGAVPNWQQGFTLLEFVDSEFWADPIHIREGRAVVRGQLYEG